jgi:hypothetical protein
MIQSETVTRFVIAGCSRSGTTYMAKLMSNLGLACGHERIFNIWRICGIGELTEPMVNFFEADSKQGDASFLSIPYLNQLPEGTVILHQVRNPLEVIRSHMGIRFFADPPVPSIYLANEHAQILDFLRKHSPEMFQTDSEIARCMRYWYFWNRIAEEAKSNASLTYLRYRVEDIDPALMRRIVLSIQPDFDENKCRQALDLLGKKTNTRPRDTTWTWDNLPSGLEKDQVLKQSRLYGYVPD